MLKLVLSSVRHNLGRYLATLIAIMTGVGFYTAVGFVSDGVISSLEGNVDAEYGNVDVAVVPDETATADETAADPETLKVPQSTVDQLLALPGVEGGAGILTGSVAFLGPDGTTVCDVGDRAPVGHRRGPEPALGTDGDAPASAGEIAVDRGTADDDDLDVGDDLTLLTLAGKEKVTARRHHRVRRLGRARQRRHGLDHRGRRVRLAQLRPGRVRVLLPRAGPETPMTSSLPPARSSPTASRSRPATSSAPTSARRPARSLKVLKNALRAFAILALLVGGFVIFNTFSVIVAQRLRELAVLAAIGATPRQLKRSLRLEGLVLGLLGSLLGVVAGYVLTLLLDGVLKVTGGSLPGGLSFGLSNVLGGIALGTIITVLSVMIPARRAARTEPIEAMRDAAVESAELGRTRGIVCVVLVALGVAGMLLTDELAVVGIGAVAIIAAVLIGAPYLAKGGARLFRPLLERFGMEGRLAVDNSVRSPKRTATTANALLIGVFLVTLVAVAGASVRDFAVGQVNDLQSADYVVVSKGGSLDDAFVSKLAAIKDVNDVVAFEREPVTIDGTATVASAGDVTELAKVANIAVDEGHPRRPRQQQR